MIWTWRMYSSWMWRHSHLSAPPIFSEDLSFIKKKYIRIYIMWLLNVVMCKIQRPMQREIKLPMAANWCTPPYYSKKVPFHSGLAHNLNIVLEIHGCAKGSSWDQGNDVILIVRALWILYSIFVNRCLNLIMSVFFSYSANMINGTMLCFEVPLEHEIIIKILGGEIRQTSENSCKSWNSFS